MKHFLDVQNGPVFALFLYVFTNFFLVLLRKKAFLRLLLCIFHNRQKKYRKPTRRCGQYVSSGMHATCEQHTQTSISASKSQYSFSCQLLPILLLYRTQRLLAARLTPPGVSRQTSRRRSSFLTEQISDSRSPATSLSPTPVNFHPFRPPTFKHSASPFFINFPPKKTEPKAQFFPLYISSTFPELCNP